MSIFDLFTRDKDGYKVKGSRLTNLAMDDYFKEAEKIKNEYGKVITEVMPQVKTKYPAFVFPISLLPASKADINEIFEMFLDGESFNFSEEERNSLSSVFIILDRFIADEDAKIKNQEYIHKISDAKK